MRDKKSQHNGHQSTATWSNLPFDLLFIIFAKMVSPIDNVHFGVVCRWWSSVRKSAMSSELKKKLPSFRPLLMLPPQRNHSTRCFFDPSRHFFHQLDLPNIRGRVILGSIDGWLLLRDDSNNISIINPWSSKYPQNQRLPSLKLGGAIKVFKAILSPPPSYMVVALVHGDYDNRHLMIAGPGESSWMYAGINWKGKILNIKDVIYYEDYFYALTDKGKIVVYSVPHRKDARIYHTHYDPPPHSQMYLAVIDKELHVVVQEFAIHIKRYPDNRSEKSLRTCGFRVFKVNFYPYDLIVGLGNEDGQVTEINDIGNFALFLGLNSSVAVAENSVCKGNCIYFSREKEVGVFNLNDGKVHNFPLELFMTHLCPFVWVTPTTSLLS